MKRFRQSQDITFRQCDPAGIVFYPRYFEMMNDVIERFFSDIVAWPYRQMHGTDRRGVPAVSANMEFMMPARLGDRLSWHLSVDRLGKSSATFRHLAYLNETAVVSGCTTVVHTDLDRMKSLPWTAEVKSVLSDYCHAEGGE